MAKIILDDKSLDNVCRYLSHKLQAELLDAVMAALEKRKEEAAPRPEFLKKMVVKGPGETDGNGNKKRG